MQRNYEAAREAAARKGNGAAAGQRGERDGLALEVLGKLREVYRTAKLHFGAASKPAGVSGAELWALWELQRHPGLRVSDLAALLSLRQSTVSNLIEGLGQARLVNRKRNDPDGRVVRLYLTRAGHKVVARAPRPARGACPRRIYAVCMRSSTACWARWRCARPVAPRRDCKTFERARAAGLDLYICGNMICANVIPQEAVCRLAAA
jgi:DNA-binding MarR family transcriptional regulator